MMQGAFVQVDADEQLGLVRVRRLQRRYEEPGDLPRTLGDIEAELDRCATCRGGLLLDFRAGPSTNATAFEECFVPFLGRACARFDRAAGLVHSAVGKLQLHRYIRQGRIANLNAFVHEPLALAFLI